MSSIKKALEEIEEIREILYHIEKILQESDLNISEKLNAYEIINSLSKNLENYNIRQRIKENLYPFYNELGKKNKISKIEISDLVVILNYLNNRLEVSDLYHNNSINSEEYYSRKINDLEQRESELKEILTFNQNETEEQRRVAVETKEKLKLIENELNLKKKELEIKEKQEDAKNDWEQKINETFNNLKKYLKPIEIERDRLNILYYVFATLGILTLLAIIICEIVLLVKISSVEGLPKLSEYIVVLLPLPIAGALMWGFIFQMNRAQRQLIALSNNIHSINYIQGLLLSINNLSIDINDGITRVNNALDKIISNHLNRKALVNENDFRNEEDKDKLEIDKVLKILTAIKK